MGGDDGPGRGPVRGEAGMSLGTGLAIADMWIGVGLCAFRAVEATVMVAILGLTATMGLANRDGE